ncbi:MAG TPA: fumarylacetoacetate hydrolase family protein [Candidatus Methylacidiphilales bacterium]|jgi:2-keto-4-pentenoate hydratase/2-oxohepta-3-ene-1,7-dioic acid hydratase in catechol pathway|nr:fumarylacetoacetate hydrolase family protein [Candidatus Methylacidiphilales bacterium]
MKIYRLQDLRHQTRQAASDDGKNFFALSGDIFCREFKITNERIDVLSLLAPIEPKTIYGIGSNYRKHAEETGSPIPEHPIVFLKSPTAVQAPGGPIVLPRHLRSDQVDFEAELGVVIGYECKNVSRADAMNYVLGYTIANDVSARDWQKQWGGSQWCRGKTFDTFCPLGPALVTPSALKNPNDLAIRTRVNGATMQESNTRDMIFPIAELIEFLSGSTTLEPGTLILTGTPEGVGMGRKPPVYLKPGDVVEVEIEGIGILRNPVVEEEL